MNNIKYGAISGVVAGVSVVFCVFLIYIFGLLEGGLNSFPKIENLFVIIIPYIFLSSFIFSIFCPILSLFMDFRNFPKIIFYTLSSFLFCAGLAEFFILNIFNLKFNYLSLEIPLFFGAVSGIPGGASYGYFSLREENKYGRRKDGWQK